MEFSVFLVPSTEKLIVTDIDGTITREDVLVSQGGAGMVMEVVVMVMELIAVLLMVMEVMVTVVMGIVMEVMHM